MIKIIAVGKLKEEYLKELVRDYLGRVNKYHKTIIFEVKDSDLVKEKSSILKQINEDEKVITLDIKGRKMDSLEFAEYLDNTLAKTSKIVFIIGASKGVHKDIIDKSSSVISFSDLTFPHGLFRGILLEQIYRAFKINNNETYHK